jgi:hypothetical protein
MTAKELASVLDARQELSPSFCIGRARQILKNGSFRNAVGRENSSGKYGDEVLVHLNLINPLYFFRFLFSGSRLQTNPRFAGIYFAIEIRII